MRIQMDLKQWCVLFVLACTLSSPGGALAVDLGVSGQIRPGGACNLTLGNGGTVDLGTLSPKDLYENWSTEIRREISLSINCETPTKVALWAIDNRQGTAIEAWPFGLGAPGGRKLGQYSFFLRNRIGDGTQLVQLINDGNGEGWEVFGVHSTRAIGPSTLSSWAVQGETLPQAFRAISSRLGVNIVLVPLRQLDLSQEVPIDGSATMELVYL